MSTLFITIVGVVVLLTILNGYMSGSMTSKIDAILGVLIVACGVYGFLKYGWVNGLYLLVGMTVFGGLFKYLLNLFGFKCFRI